MTSDGKTIVSISEWCTRRCLQALILLTLICIAMPALSQVSPAPIDLAERPSVNGEPTVLDVGVFIMDIDEISDVNQRFRTDLFLVVRWQDSRLALPITKREGKERFMALNELWTPRLLLFNDRGMEPQLREGALVDDLGNVTLRNRLRGELAVDLEFQDFPFDVQRLLIDIVSYENTADALEFSANSVIVSQADKFSIEGWRLKQLEPETGGFVVPGTSIQLPRLTYVIEAKRSSEYYLLTMLVPMALIIFMAWTVFWLQPEIVPSRIAISTASIFSLIALGVSIRLGLPKISYLTKADIFVLFCTLMIFIALGVAVLGSRWVHSNRTELALKANAIARWVYMFMFIIVVIATISF